jgi:hypothetical protein
MFFYSLSLLAVKKTLHIVSPSLFILCIDVEIVDVLYLFCASMFYMLVSLSIYCVHGC